MQKGDWTSIHVVYSYTSLVALSRIKYIINFSSVESITFKL